MNNLVSIILPFRALNDICINTIKAIKQQTFQSIELILVNVSKNPLRADELDDFDLRNFKLIHAPQAMPGEARNIGIAKASGQYFAFIDEATSPVKTWIDDALSMFSSNSNLEVIWGHGNAVAYSLIQKLFKASSYGNKSFQCLPGTVIKKNSLNKIGFMIPNVRAGEDIEWLQRAKILDLSSSVFKKSILIYKGIPKGFFEGLLKWHNYSISNASINILNTQKFSYLFILMVFFLYLAYSWNYVATGINWDRSVYFIPNLNTYLWTLVFGVYFTYRALILPLRKNEKVFFLLPFNWFLVGIISLSIDLMKFPGRILSIYKVFKS